jgi:hypothetical protein
MRVTTDALVGATAIGGASWPVHDLDDQGVSREARGTGGGHRHAQLPESWFQLIIDREARMVACDLRRSDQGDEDHGNAGSLRSSRNPPMMRP